jgi:mRNA-degrading endonuclease YafQ of YafQ-DinJ toxin-antitoxin module
MSRILQTPTFKRTAKKLHKSEKQVLDNAVEEIAVDPACGEVKVGDLAGVIVFKFRMNSDLKLLAYEYFENENEIKLLALGSHENFYRDLK